MKKILMMLILFTPFLSFGVEICNIRFISIGTRIHYATCTSQKGKNIVERIDNKIDRKGEELNSLWNTGWTNIDSHMLTRKIFADNGWKLDSSEKSKGSFSKPGKTYEFTYILD